MLYMISTTKVHFLDLLDRVSLLRLETKEWHSCSCKNGTAGHASKKVTKESSSNESKSEFDFNDEHVKPTRYQKKATPVAKPGTNKKQESSDENSSDEDSSDEAGAHKSILGATTQTIGKS